MTTAPASEKLDRHVLAVAIWLAFGIAALVLFDHGLGGGGAPFLLAGAAAILTAFAGHVIVNAVYRTTFTRGELALGLVVYSVALLAFGIVMLFSPGFASRDFLVLSLCFIVIGTAIVFYMVTHFGVRRVFEGFNVIADFNSRREEDRLPPTGGAR